MNLAQSSYQIYLQDPDKILSNIYWESCSGISEQANPINTSNGKIKYTIPTKPVLQPITISRASNLTDDKKIKRWLDSFCSDRELSTTVSQGTILMLVPLKACGTDEPYDETIKIFNCVPTSYQMFNAVDIMNTTDVSRTTIQLSPESWNLS